MINPIKNLEKTVYELFTSKKLTLALAESCTGGSLANRLITIPGASQYFLGSIVTYSNKLKKTLLNVPEIILKEKGAVSEETVVAMVEGLLTRTSADFGIALSGTAGPDGGTFEKPVGTVWIAIKRKGEEAQAWKFLIEGDRQTIIEEAGSLALEKLLEVIYE